MQPNSFLITPAVNCGCRAISHSKSRLYSCSEGIEGRCCCIDSCGGHGGEKLLNVAEQVTTGASSSVSCREDHPIQPPAISGCCYKADSNGVRVDTCSDGHPPAGDCCLFLGSLDSLENREDTLRCKGTDPAARNGLPQSQPGCHDPCIISSDSSRDVTLVTSSQSKEGAQKLSQNQWQEIWDEDLINVLPPVAALTQSQLGSTTLVGCTVAAPAVNHHVDAFARSRHGRFTKRSRPTRSFHTPDCIDALAAAAYSSHCTESEKPITIPQLPTKQLLSTSSPLASCATDRQSSGCGLESLTRPALPPTEISLLSLRSLLHEASQLHRCSADGCLDAASCRRANVVQAGSKVDNSSWLPWPCTGSVSHTNGAYAD